MPGGQETRVIDPDTGAAKGSKLARFDLIPPRPLWRVAEVYGIGSRKYDDRNWEKGYSWGLSLAALERHLNLWKQGEVFATDDGQHHLASVIWHCLTLMEFEETHPEKDDVHVSPKRTPVRGPEEGDDQLLHVGDRVTYASSDFTGFKHLEGRSGVVERVDHRTGTSMVVFNDREDHWILLNEALRRG
jgi:hypothetical protein